MNKTVYKNFVKILSVAIATGSLIFNASNAASRTAVRGSVASRRPVASTTRTGTTTNPVTTETPATTETTPEPVPETAPAPEPEPEVFENKTAQFDVVLSEISSGDGDNLTSDLAEQIRKQRAAAEARDDLNIAISNLQKSSKSGKNTCDAGLRQCMQKTCGTDFTKCATDGDTLFGDKLNKCRRETTCTGEEFRLFTTEIKADRDMNVKLSSYNAVINCGNNYNSCIQKECGQTFEKCLGKTAADNAVKKCATTAKNCTEQDSGLAARFGKVIGGLRLDAEQDVTNDEKRLLELRDLMRKQCEHLGAMFDERSFDCVYTVNFFAGTNQTSPMASRKLYAGDTFICTQEWFGTNVTTFKENAYRETRAQTGASSAMLGSGLGTAAGLISSGAIGRALETQQAKKDLKAECTAQGGVLKNGECVSSTTGERISTPTETTVTKPQKQNNPTSPQPPSDEEIKACKKWLCENTVIVEKTPTVQINLNVTPGAPWQPISDPASITSNWKVPMKPYGCNLDENAFEFVPTETIEDHERDACEVKQKLEKIQVDQLPKAIAAKVSKINKATNTANMIGSTISFISQANTGDIYTATQNWRNKCETFTKTDSGILGAKVEETISDGEITWECVATKCDSTMSLELKNGECKMKSFSNEGINNIISGAINFRKKK